MTRLTSAIVSHDLLGIEKAVAEEPQLLREPVTGWLPIEWARRTGNFVTLVRLLRCMGNSAPEENFEGLLGQYVALLSADEFEPVSLPEGASMAWDAAFHGRVHKVGRWRRDFVSSPQQAQDIRFLIEKCGLCSRAAIIERFRRAQPGVEPEGPTCGGPAD